jgi:hypothetical protein
MQWYEHLWGWAGLFFSIIGSVTSIAFIINWVKRMRKRKALCTKLKEISLADERGLQEYQETVIDLLAIEPEIKNPFQLADEDINNAVKAVLFTMVKKHSDYLNIEEADKK